MRITAGNAKGHSIQVPIGVSDLRPSQDKVREAIFNILGEYTEGKAFLDLYAGTGALGIEALSRNAKTCDFVEKSKEACDTIIKNLNHSKLENKSDIFNDKVELFLNTTYHDTYDVVLMDPPYVLNPINAFRLLPRFIKPKGLIVYLHGSRIAIEDLNDRTWLSNRFNTIESRRYGNTNVTFMQINDNFEQ